MHEDVVEHVNAAGNHHVIASGDEFHDCKMDGAHGACTGSVNNTVRASKIQTIADSSGHNVSQKPRERVFLPGYI